MEKGFFFFFFGCETFNIIGETLSSNSDVIIYFLFQLKFLHVKSYFLRKLEHTR
jgi:hypothetical protein